MLTDLPFLQASACGTTTCIPLNPVRFPEADPTCRQRRKRTSGHNLITYDAPEDPDAAELEAMAAWRPDFGTLPAAQASYAQAQCIAQSCRALPPKRAPTRCSSGFELHKILQQMRGSMEEHVTDAGCPGPGRRSARKEGPS